MCIVDETIRKINDFNTIDELHDYISNELDLSLFTYEEFLIVWKYMNFQKYK